MENSFSTSSSSKRTLFSSVVDNSKEDLEERINNHNEVNTIPLIKNELMIVQNHLGHLESDNCLVSQGNHLRIEDIQSLTVHKSDNNLLNAASDLDHQNILESDLHIGSLNSTGNALTIGSHYYEGINPTSIMVYQVPSGNIVPFDSIVPVSFEKASGEKQDVTTEMLQNSLSQEVYDHSSQPIQHSLYILPHESNNIYIDKNSYARSDKAGLPDQIQTEFSLATSNYESAFPSTSNSMNQFSMSVAYNASHIDTCDSEVALTLASLGNLKRQNLRDVRNCFKGDTPNALVQDSGPCKPLVLNEKLTKSDAKSGNQNKISQPTLILRSRKLKGGANLITTTTEDLPPKEKKKTCRKKVPKCTNKKSHKIEEEEELVPSNVKKAQSDKPKSIYEPQKENLLGQLLIASKHCEPASLIPEGVVDDVIPAVGYRIMDMSNLSEMICMMHRCSHVSSGGPIVIQEQASLREGVVSQLSIICTGCQEGAVCPTSNKVPSFNAWDINTRIEQLTSEFNIDEKNVQRMLEILGIFYRPTVAGEPLLNLQEQPPEKQLTKKKKKQCKLPKDKNVQCQVCHELFQGENHLKSHMNIHNNALHRCPYCQAYFKKTYNLKEHIKKHENHKYECPECNNFYADRSTLHTHIKTIHENRSRLECEVCSKKFWIKSHHKEHMRLHTGEKPYSCDVCGKDFMWLNSLKKHMKTHSAESKFKCRLCGKWFKWLLAVRHHLLYQHKLEKNDVDDQVVTAVADILPNQNISRVQVVKVSESSNIGFKGDNEFKNTTKEKNINPDGSHQVIDNCEKL